MTTKTELTQILGVMTKVYPYFKLEKGEGENLGTIDIYLLILQDIPYDLLSAAARQWLSTANAFFPKPGELRELALSLKNKELPTSGEAWEEVKKEMHRCGDYFRYTQSEFCKYPEWSLPIIKKIIDIMGYRTLYESETVMADRAHFMKLYDQLADREEKETKLLPGVKAVSEKYRLGVSETVKRLT